jgi:methylphosphotriester-DNA--protein-cysteine methyltransferase
VPDDVEAGTTEKLAKLLLIPKKVNSLKSADHSFTNNALANNTDTTNKRHFVANKNSDVYHCSDCKWSKKIKPDNMIKFSSSLEAEGKNFFPCSNCKPDRLESIEGLKSNVAFKKISNYR